MNRRNFFSKAAAFVAGCALGVKASASNPIKIIRNAKATARWGEVTTRKGYFFAEFKYLPLDTSKEFQEIIIHQRVTPNG